jgi:hypothetical protein
VRSQARFNALPDQLEVMAPQAVVTESTDDDVALREARLDVQAALATLSRPSAKSSTSPTGAA